MNVPPKPYTPDRQLNWGDAFYPDGLNKPLAELSKDETIEASHRTRAMHEFKEYLVKNIDKLIELFHKRRERVKWIFCDNLNEAFLISVNLQIFNMKTLFQFK